MLWQHGTNNVTTLCDNTDNKELTMSKHCGDKEPTMSQNWQQNHQCQSTVTPRNNVTTQWQHKTNNVTTPCNSVSMEKPRWNSQLVSIARTSLQLWHPWKSHKSTWKRSTSQHYKSDQLHTRQLKTLTFDVLRGLGTLQPLEQEDEDLPHVLWHQTPATQHPTFTWYWASIYVHLFSEPPLVNDLPHVLTPGHCTTTPHI